MTPTLKQTPIKHVKQTSMKIAHTQPKPVTRHPIRKLQNTRRPININTQTPISLAGEPKRTENTGQSGKSRNPENPKNENLSFSHHVFGISAENAFPEVPQSSCIFWDGRGPFLRHLNFSIFVRPGTNQKMMPKLLPFTPVSYTHLRAHET